MKVTLLKDHLGNKEGDTVEIADEQVDYFNRVGLIDTKEKSEKTDTKEKSETKHTPKKEVKGNLPK